MDDLGARDARGLRYEAASRLVSLRNLVRRATPVGAPTILGGGSNGTRCVSVAEPPFPGFIDFEKKVESGSVRECSIY